MPATRTHEVKSILTPTSGFIRDAGFTHSLTPARNCTFGCTYCYVPTMKLYGGLTPEDWQHWGQFTSFKQNAPELLDRQLRPNQRIYCSPLVDPYQPAEAEEYRMPAILEAVLQRPPRVFAIQTRGPAILRDLDLLRKLAQVTKLRVSFSVTTNRELIRRLYEPHCAGYEERLATIRSLVRAGIETFATLAPLLPCDPELMIRDAIEVSGSDVIGDPLHLRAVKRHGATTRDAAFRIAEVQHHEEWFDAAFQHRMVSRLEAAAAHFGRRFVTGVPGFALLARDELLFAQP